MSTMSKLHDLTFHYKSVSSLLHNHERQRNVVIMYKRKLKIAHSAYFGLVTVSHRAGLWLGREMIGLGVRKYNLQI